MREKIARAIEPTDWRLADNGTFPPGHPAYVSVTRSSLEAADRVLIALEATDA